MKKRLKVLHVINSLKSGGAENLLVNSLSPGGLQQHLDNELVYLRDASYLKDKLDPDVITYDLQYKGKTDLIKMLFRLKKLIKKNGYDIIHSHLPHAGLYTEIVRPNNIPHLHTIHSTYSINKKGRSSFQNWLDKKILLEKKSANIVVISDYNKTDFLKDVNFKGNIYTLHNFVEDIYFKNKLPYKPHINNDLKIIAVGNLNKGKNYGYLIEIFKHLKNEPIRLDVFGGGDKTKCEESLKKEGITNITFKGAVSNVYDHITQYDLFIMASKFEGFGLAVFEAMASGIPVMLSDIPSLKSLVKEHAIYFDLNNAKAAAEKLIKILHGEIPTTSLIKDARNYSESIAKRENYIKSLLTIYYQIIDTKESQ